MAKQNEKQQIPNRDLAKTETKVERGWGACSASGCNCKGFTGNADTCGNCGHNYATHW